MPSRTVVKIKAATINKTSKEIRARLTPQENSLKNKLHKFYKQNIRGRQEPTESLQRIHEQRIKIIIRQAVQQAYLTGVSQVSKTVGERREFFISVTDVENIKDITEQMSNQFWVTTGKLHRRENEFIISLATQEMVKKQEFDTEAAYIAISSMMVWFTYNTSLVSKSMQVK